MCGSEKETVGPGACPVVEDVIGVNEEEEFAFAFTSVIAWVPELRKIPPVAGGGELLGCSVFTTTLIVFR